MPVAIAFTAALWLGAARERTALGRFATWTGLAVIAVFVVGLIGFFKGGYNRVIKNAVYFVGGEEAMMRLVPDWFCDPNLVELPNDFVFEASGIAQFPLAVLTWRLARQVS